MSSLALRLGARRQVPVGRVKIDWRHPLARGLVACYLPGTHRGINLAIPGLVDLTSGSGAGFVNTADGPALQSWAASSSLSGLIAGPLKTWTEQSLFWRGNLNSTSIGVGVSFLGSTYDNAGGSPYFGASIWSQGTNVLLGWNSGGVYAQSSSAVALAVEAGASLGGTFKVGGNAVLYTGGGVRNTTAFGASNPSSSATATLDIGGYTGASDRFTAADTQIACIWDRELSAAEMAEMNANPFGFLIPDEGEWPALYVASASITAAATITEADDSVSSAATLALKAAASITEAGDTSAATGTVALKAAASITEADDSLSAASTLALKASSSISEADDTLTSAAALALKAAAAITEADDSLSASAGSAITAAAAITEADDTVAATGTLPIVATASLAEADDSLSAAGVLPIVGALTATEADDGLSATGRLAIVAGLSLTEADDTLVAAGREPSETATPAERTVSVAAELRSVSVAAEVRSVRVAAETRTVSVPAETRLVAA